MAGMGRAPSGAMAMEDVGDLQRGAAHRRRFTLRSHPFLRQQPDPVERAHDGANRVGGDAGIERGGVELGVPEQYLDDADVDVLFQQMRGEAVAQRVRRHPLPDLGGLPPRRGPRGSSAAWRAA